MIVVDSFEQQSPEWYAARAGIPSASCFDKIVTSKGKRSTQRKAYLNQLAGEAILKTKEEGYSNATMERGIELESEARAMYEFANGVDVQEIALCYKDENRRFSCSPDGLVGDDGAIEIKCPKLHTHVEYVLGQKLPTKYFQQVQGQTYVMGRDWVDFVSYYPGLPLFTVRVEPDHDFHAKLEKELALFCGDLDATVHELKNILNK